jgi:hypothetical protein
VSEDGDGLLNGIRHGRRYDMYLMWRLGWMRAG